MKLIKQRCWGYYSRAEGLGTNMRLRRSLPSRSYAARGTYGPQQNRDYTAASSGCIILLEIPQNSNKFKSMPTHTDAHAHSRASKKSNLFLLYYAVGLWF